MATLDYEYGFRISTFTVSSTKAIGGPFPLDFPVLGDGGAMGVYLDALNGLVDAKGYTDTKDRYLSVENVKQLGCCLLAELRGGPSGDESDIVKAETNKIIGKITKEDALTWISRVLLVFPPGNYVDGFLVAEVKGRGSHGVALQDRLERLLKENDSLRPEVRHDVADGIAWRTLFETQNARTQELEFTFANPAGDGTEFTEDRSVKRVRLSYTLEAEGAADKKATQVIVGDKPDRKGALLTAVGGHKYAPEDVEDAVATVVANGKARKYRVSNTQTQFTRIIESPTQLEEREFLMEVGSAVVETAAAMGIDLPNDWLPIPKEE